MLDTAGEAETDSSVLADQQRLTYITAQSAGADEYTGCISAERIRPSPQNECPVMTLNNLRVKLQCYWNFTIKMRSTPSLQSFPGPLLLGVIAADWAVFMGQIELFDI